MIDHNSRRRNVSSGAPWETIHGYSRAVRIGPHIAVSGTAAVGPGGEALGGADMYLQAVKCLEIIEAALQKSGASLDDVIRTRVFTTDISQWEAIARAHNEFFAAVRPASTLLEVSRLISPALLVEIEADAICEA